MKTQKQLESWKDFIFSLHLTNIFLVFIAIAFVSRLIFNKFFFIESLDYTSDVFTHLQLTRSLFEEGRFLYDYTFGHHAQLHSYFSLVIFYPLTLLGGIFSFSLATLLLLILGLIFLSQKHFPLSARPRDLFFFLVVFLMNPITIWIFDHPTYSWNPDILYWPLGLLWAVLKVRKSFLVYSVAILILLTKEDGAVLLCCLELLHLFVIKPLDNNSSLLKKSLWPDFFRIVVVCILLFCLNMGLIAWFNSHTGESLTQMRTSEHLMEFLQLFNNLKLFSAFGFQIILLFVFTFICGLIMKYFCLWTNNIQIPIKILFVKSLCFTPMLIVLLISSSGYSFNYNEFGLFWPNRFAAIWGYELAFFCFLLCLKNPSSNIFDPRHIGLITHSQRINALSLAFILTTTIFTVPRYSLVQRFFPEFHRHSLRLITDRLLPDEVDFIRCINKHLASRTFVLVQGDFFGAFQNHTLLWPGKEYLASKPPELILCDSAGRLTFPGGCLESIERWRTNSHFVSETDYESLRLLTSSKTQFLLEQCIHLPK